MAISEKTLAQLLMERPELSMFDTNYDNDTGVLTLLKKNTDRMGVQLSIHNMADRLNSGQSTLEDEIGLVTDALSQLDTMAKMPFNKVEKHLLFRLVDKNFFEHIDKIAAVPYTADGGVYIALVEDTPKMCKYVPKETFDEWGKSFDQLLSIAKANLRKLPFKRVALGNGFLYNTYDSYDASRLTLIDPTKFGSIPLEHLYVAIPHRDALMIFDDRQIPLAENKEKIRDRYESSNYNISPNLYRYINGKWTASKS